MIKTSDRNWGAISYEVAIFGACFLLVWQICATLGLCEFLTFFGIQFENEKLAHLVSAAIVMLVVLGVRLWQRNRQILLELNKSKTSKSELIKQLCYDEQTGLPNRRYVDRILQQIESGKAKDLPTHCDFYAIELNHLAGLKQARGQQFCDSVVRVLADRLEHLAGKRRVARFAENRFFLFFDTRGPEASAEFFERLQATLSKPVEAGQDVVKIDWIMGSSKFPQDGNRLGDCVNYAELALSYIDQSSRSQISPFCLDVAAKASARASLERDLREAVLEKHLTLHFQPFYRLSSGEIAGFEALARWTKKDGTTVSPVDFVPVAEETGLIAPMTFDLFSKSIAELKRWPESQSLAFNICATLLEDNSVIDRLLSIMVAERIDFSRVEFEITESHLMDDCETAIENVRRLRKSGVRFALDDMGTGYSTFLRLAYVEIDKVKIDRAFTKRMLADERTAKVVSGMISMARELGAEIVVEGVETEAQLRRVLGLRCQYVQGFLLAKPRDAEAAFLASSLAPIDIPRATVA